MEKEQSEEIKKLYSEYAKQCALYEHHKTEYRKAKLEKESLLLKIRKHEIFFYK